MKVKYFSKMKWTCKEGGATQEVEHKIITAVTDAAYDPEATKQTIAPLIQAGMSAQEKDQLYMAHLEYGHPGPEGELVDDETAVVIQEKLAGRGKHQLLLDNGEYIDNYCGVEYWIERSGVWEKEKIEKIGIPLPAGAVLPDQLTAEQQREIAGQQEAERIAALTPEERAGEQIAEIQAKLAEIDLLDGPRPIREAVRDMAESAGLNTSFLMKHEDEAIALREQLAAYMAAGD